MTPIIRNARSSDVSAIVRIYGEAVRCSVATLDLVEPPSSYWKDKVSSTVFGNQALVIEVNTVVLGYAYSDTFRPRPGYSHTRETSVYLDSTGASKGLGLLIYSELLSRLRADGIHLAVAVVAQPNPASVALHEKLGFELVGTLREVGRKFDRWVDTRWYQLALDGFAGACSLPPTQ